MARKGKAAGGTVALGDLVVFTRQLATMIDAGLAMVQSLQALGEKAKAAAAFEKALALRIGMSGKQISDAEAQLAALKG